MAITAIEQRKKKTGRSEIFRQFFVSDWRRFYDAAPAADDRLFNWLATALNAEQIAPLRAP